MAITDKKTGVWGLDQVYNKENQGSIWSYDATDPFEFWLWGKQESGSWGINLGGNLYRSSPVQLPGNTWQTEFYNNHNQSWHRIITKTDGTLWAWGKGKDWGQLGLNQQGPSIMYSSPVQIGSGTDWKLGGTTREGSFAIKTDGTFWTWGSNQMGELGQNSLAVRSSPVQIPGTTWDKAYGGYNTILAIKTDGTLWSMGSGGSGRGGLNTNTHVSSPTQIGSDTDWASASMNTSRGAGAIKTDGTLWMWGDGGTGSNGQNNLTQYSSPVQVPGTWSYFENAGEGAAGRKTDGTLWAWGGNDKGNLGQNDGVANNRRSSPVQIGSDTNWDRISMSGNTSMATKTDGTLWTWGFNNAGCLGQNQAPAQLAATSSPVQIPGTSWVTVGHAGQGYQIMATKNI